MTGAPAARHAETRAAALASAMGLFRAPQAGSSKPLCMSTTNRAAFRPSAFNSCIPGKVRRHLVQRVMAVQNGDAAIGKSDNSVSSKDLEVHHCRVLVAVDENGG